MSENPYLSGNFAPVQDELTATDLPVRGELPRELCGRLLRIGPNPLGEVDPATHHWFVGSGLVHGVRLREGRAEWYRRRFVRDDHVVEVKGWPPVEGPEHAEELGGGANTNVIGHAGRTYAVVEAGSRPVGLDYELETIARSDFHGTLPGSFTAHPKRDPETGELWALAYYYGWEHVQVLRVGADGRVKRVVEVPMPHKPMIHDCAITPNWFAILDLPVTFDPSVVERGYQLPYAWQEDRPARVGLMPRSGGADDVVWCELDPCWVFHPLNAFEDAAGRMVIDVVRHPKVFASDLRGPNEGTTTLDRWLIDPAGGPVKEERLDDRGIEFPRHDERRVGLPYRYGYAVGLSGGFEHGGLHKIDLERGTSEVRDESPERCFMEPVFVPRHADADEDDGWLLAYRHDQARNRGDVVVLSAQDVRGEPLATVELPDRVPFGFHGNWVPDAD